MKWIYAFATVAILANCALAYEVEEEDGDARVGYIGVDNDGTTSITFNATSIQNGVILFLFLMVLGALLLPLFTTPTDGPSAGYGYGSDQTGYEDPAAGYASGFARRSMLNGLGPVMDALSAGYKKYNEDDE